MITSGHAGPLITSEVAGPDDRRARQIVWGVWLATLLLLVWLFARFASPIPLAEDWLTVSPLVGNEPNLAAWLWEQNNEHRMPVARLLLLCTLKAARGDFRAGGLLNLALLAGAAAGLILFVRRLRGRTDVADAFFPLLLLHFGQSNQVLFAWQITFVLSILLIVAGGCALFAPGSVTRPGPAAVAGVVLLLLPASGFIGLLFVPVLGGCLLYASFACWRGWRGWPERRGVSVWLMVACGGAAAMTALYFIGYEWPWWNPPSPGVVPSSKTALKVFSLAFGPAAAFWWPPAVAVAVFVATCSLWQAGRHALQRSGAARDHALGALVFLAASIGFILVVGWGRAGYVPEFGIPIRYIVLGLPFSIASFATWAASPDAAGRTGTRCLAVLMLVLLPLNTIAGSRFFAEWYRDGMTRVQADLREGVPIDELARRHQRFLVHWWTPADLAWHMRMLHDAGIAPFDRAALMGAHVRNVERVP